MGRFVRTFDHFLHLMYDVFLFLPYMWTVVFTSLVVSIGAVVRL